MGINLEFVDTMLELGRLGRLASHRNVIELGAQDISADPCAVGRRLAEAGFGSTVEPVAMAAELYRRLGYASYAAIDANGAHGARALDLNRDLAAQGLAATFDLVTNLGTIEHCFDQAAAFRNMHRLCRPGGLMIHCLPAQGLVNHGFYNYHPRFVADLAAANGYAIEQLFFTVDFHPERYRYAIDLFRAHDTRDLLLYAVLERRGDADFRNPFDGMFAAENRVGYTAVGDQAAVLAGEFQPYVRSSWDNVRRG